jgi:hypothetical protein
MVVESLKDSVFDLTKTSACIDGHIASSVKLVNKGLPRQECDRDHPFDRDLSGQQQIIRTTRLPPMG